MYKTVGPEYVWPGKSLNWNVNVEIKSSELARIMSEMAVRSLKAKTGSLWPVWNLISEDAVVWEGKKQAWVENLEIWKEIFETAQKEVWSV